MSLGKNEILMFSASCDQTLDFCIFFGIEEMYTYWYMSE